MGRDPDGDQGPEYQAAEGEIENTTRTSTREAPERLAKLRPLRRCFAVVRSALATETEMKEKSTASRTSPGARAAMEEGVVQGAESRMVNPSTRSARRLQSGESERRKRSPSARSKRRYAAGEQRSLEGSIVVDKRSGNSPKGFGSTSRPTSTRIRQGRESPTRRGRLRSALQNAASSRRTSSPPRRSSPEAPEKAGAGGRHDGWHGRHGHDVSEGRSLATVRSRRRRPCVVPVRRTQTLNRKRPGGADCEGELGGGGSP